ncbi:MAG: Gfo/Idh/MocA family protein [Bacteroidota bacterium]
MAYNRRTFIKTSALAVTGAGFSFNLPEIVSGTQNGKRVGIIGLDTSHSTAFTREFNQADAGPELGGYRVVAAYPYGSREIESSYSRIPEYTEVVKNLGVRIVDSIEELLKETDVILLNTNDGRLHLGQALPVIRAGKRMFIDKPMTASLKDAVKIFEEAALANTPVFSCSSLRYMENVQKAVQGEYGKIFGATAWSPAVLEKTHPDLFWYGIHGVETLITAMGTGCKSLTRHFTEGTDVVTGFWEDGRIGTFRGIREGKSDYGGVAFTEKAVVNLGPYQGYKPMLVEIARFFDTGITPVKPKETLEILAFMEAADSSRQQNGARCVLPSF